MLATITFLGIHLKKLMQFLNKVIKGSQKYSNEVKLSTIVGRLWPVETLLGRSLAFFRFLGAQFTSATLLISSQHPGLVYNCCSRSLFGKNSFNMSTAATSMMDKVREKMQALKDKIEEAEERELMAKAEMKDAEARAYQHESDLDSMQNRMALIEKDLAKTTKQLDEKREKLEQLENKQEEDSEVVRKLEGVELDGDERLIELEEMLKEATAQADQFDHRNIEIIQKLQQTESELAKQRARADAAEALLEKLQTSVDEAGDNLKNLEMKDSNASQWEAETEEKIQFLEEQLKEILAQAEDTERRCAPLERTLDEHSVQIEEFRRKKEEVEKEMEEMAELVEMSIE